MQYFIFLDGTNISCWPQVMRKTMEGFESGVAVPLLTKKNRRLFGKIVASTVCIGSVDSMTDNGLSTLLYRPRNPVIHTWDWPRGRGRLLSISQVFYEQVSEHNLFRTLDRVLQLSSSENLGARSMVHCFLHYGILLSQTWREL